MPKISVIVPVYNVEKYLNRCVDSIINQTFTDYELILVDDGSPDNCGKICDEYAAKDTRVVVIHKENGGVSSARNFGIKKSTGKYLVFVDSDDYIGEKYLELLCNDNQSDLVLCNVVRFYENKYIETIDIPENIIFTKPLSFYYLYTKYNFFSPYNKLFDASIIRLHNISFPTSYKWGEDGVFVSEYICYVDKINAIGYNGYFYRLRDGDSLATQFRPDVINDITNSRLLCLQNIKRATNMVDYKYFEELIKKDIKRNCAFFVKKIFYSKSMRLKEASSILDCVSKNAFVKETFLNPKLYYEVSIRVGLRCNKSFFKILSFRLFKKIDRVRYFIKKIIRI